MLKYYKSLDYTWINLSRNKEAFNHYGGIQIMSFFCHICFINVAGYAEDLNSVDWMDHFYPVCISFCLGLYCFKL